jgi:hypothetical protein
MENPFRIGERVTGEHFTDRADEVRIILRAMRDPARLLVYGPRRMGKSSAIEMASVEARRRGTLVIRADLARATSLREVADRLATSVAREVDEDDGATLRDWVRALNLELTVDASGAPVLRFRFDRSAPSPEELPAFEAVLDRVEAMAAAGRPVCVVLDEFQRILGLGHERADWQLRDIMQGHHHLSYVCAGSDEGVIEHLTSKSGAFHGTFERLYVGALPADDFARWIDSRLEASGARKASGMGSAVIRLAGPRTEDVLKLARQVWSRAAARGHASEGDPESALEEVIRGDGGVFQQIWDGQTTHQRNVLRAVAAGQNALTSADVMRRFGLRSSSAVTQALNSLASKGLLMRRGGVTAFDDPFFRAWVVMKAPPGLVEL